MKTNHKLKNILITGGNGFIGHNFIKYFLKKNKKTQVINIDKISKYSIKKNKIKLKQYKNFKFIKGDINNYKKIEFILSKYSINTVINFAAESHVDRSIDAPKHFFKNNVTGTINLANQCVYKWSKFNFKNTRFIQISTDEVFGSISGSKSVDEKSKYQPNSPYSSSKASADLGLISFNKTYGLPINILYISNNFGPYQNQEKFIPKVIQCCFKKKKIPIYGNGLNIRQWIYTEDTCKAIYKILLYAKSNEHFNIGTKFYSTNINLAFKICNIFSDIDKKFNYKKLIKFVKDRPGHDFRYSLNTKKIKTSLDWQPKNSFDQDLKKTISWYLKNY